MWKVATCAVVGKERGGKQPRGIAYIMVKLFRLTVYPFTLAECPTAMDGMERFACPTPDLQGRYRCIDDHVLCDGFIDCPEGEDEDRRSCMFYKTVSVAENSTLTLRFFYNFAIFSLCPSLFADEGSFGCVSGCVTTLGAGALSPHKTYTDTHKQTYRHPYIDTHTHRQTDTQYMRHLENPR